jgi:hypothetical protein
MKNTKLNFVLGVVLGAVLAFVYLNYFAPRYEINKVGLTLVKTDKWTGQSWKFVNDNWKKVVNTSQEWKEIDQALAEALNIPVSNNPNNSALKLLREKYPILKDIPNDDLQERIKLVYSSQMLQELYLDDFMKQQKQLEEEPQEE